MISKQSFSKRWRFLMSNGKKNAEENIFEEKAGGNRRKIVYQ